MKKSPINWLRVEEAMRRSKRGMASPDDQSLCVTAFSIDPKEYGRRKQAVDEGVNLEEMTRYNEKS